MSGAASDPAKPYVSTLRFFETLRDSMKTHLDLLNAPPSLEKEVVPALSPPPSPSDGHRGRKDKNAATAASAAATASAAAPADDGGTADATNAAGGGEHADAAAEGDAPPSEAPAPIELNQTPLLIVPKDDIDCLRYPAFMRCGPAASPDRPFVSMLLNAQCVYGQ
jgi:hypothetical protein